MTNLNQTLTAFAQAVSEKILGVLTEMKQLKSKIETLDNEPVLLWEGSVKTGTVTLSQPVFGKMLSVYIQDTDGSIDSSQKIITTSFFVPQQIDSATGYRIGDRVNYKQYEFEIDATGMSLLIHNSNNEYLKKVYCK